MLRIACTIAVAAVAYAAASPASNAAPIAPPSAIDTSAGSVILAGYHGHGYRWHGQYYPYRWHGHYYHHRHWGHGHWRYW